MIRLCRENHLQRSAPSEHTATDVCVRERGNVDHCYTRICLLSVEHHTNQMEANIMGTTVRLQCVNIKYTMFHQLLYDATLKAGYLLITGLRFFS